MVRRYVHLAPEQFAQQARVLDGVNRPEAIHIAKTTKAVSRTISELV